MRRAWLWLQSVSCQAFALWFRVICTEILLVRYKCAIQRNNMRLLVVTVQQYELCLLTLTILVLYRRRKLNLQFYKSLFWKLFENSWFNLNSIVFINQINPVCSIHSYLTIGDQSICSLSLPDYLVVDSHIWRRK